MSKTVDLKAADGHTLSACVAEPAGAPRGGVVVVQVLAAHPETEGHFCPAGRGFHCDQRGSYHQPSAALARQRTVDFFRAHVG